ncbi:hypothetical protein PTSG_09675 [Salpingoeca rosetta]|uniref:Uncharacterized protein n=1 Tax=Salpingoeca rosetta (strain ATCC 50818 / BSB-021) TaxID=946362 RepID=F2ULN8_SALR5|nr:uncharacterized protein PTSG_09675 [Salpingoeca rosetta]EGD78037.1 hypothetical protein PTSG_09675 [Salpingoeca rosetta]|eukprot:XP_004990099.1 hypothetical protein PTSG_09675 [Salpingoeca rosetta]
MAGDGEVPSLDELMTGSRSSNPVYFNWLSFCKEDGGDKAKAAMEGHLTSFGVVSALLGAFFIAGLQAPPVREGEPFDHAHWEEQLYAHAAGISFLLNIFCVTLVVILYAYASLYTAEEFGLYLYHYALVSATLPPVLTAVSTVVGMFAVVLRVRTVYGSPAWIVIASIAGLGTVLLLWLMAKMDIATTKLRRARNNRPRADAAQQASSKTTNM